MTRFELPISTSKPDPADSVAFAGHVRSDVAVRNLLWFIRLRWVVVAVLVIVELTAFLLEPTLRRFGVVVPTRWPAILALLLILANVAYLLHARKLTPQGRSGLGIYLNLWSQIVLDLAALTVVVHYLGSLTTFICFAYLFHTVLACIFFPPRWSLAVTLLACLFYIACVVAELSGLLPLAGIYSPEINQSLRAGLTDSSFRVAIHLGSALAIFLVVWYLASNLSSAVRQRDRQLLAVNKRLLALDRERTQHMLHTTHELKAPFAAIQSYVQLLLKGYCGPLTDDSRDVLSRIDARSQRLSNQIREMLQLANLRSATAGDRPREQLDLAELLTRALASSQAQAQARGISFVTDLQQAPAIGVPSQLEMMLINVLANAVQYSHPQAKVSVTSGLLDDGSSQVRISDEGIGIRPDVLPRIFDEYYRSKEAAEHNPMCTGLGLAIVKHIAITHGIAVRVDSQPGRGTTFTLTFPSPSPHRLPLPQPTVDPDDPLG